MPDSAEYLREITALITEQNSSILLSQDFTTVNPFSVGGDASTKSLAIVTDDNRVFSGDGALKMSMQDATGTGTLKQVSANIRYAPRNSEKLRYQYRFQCDNAQADWGRISFLVYRYRADSAYSVFSIRFNCNLGVDNVFEYYNNSTWQTVALTEQEGLYQASTSYTDTWHFLQMDVDWDNDQVTRIQFNDQIITDAITDAPYRTGSQSNIDTFEHYVQWYADADNTEHNLYLDNFSVIEL